MHVILNHAELYQYLKEGSKIDIPTFVVKKDVVKEKPTFKCEECGKDFSNKGGLKAHMVYHSNLRPFPCTICNKAFKTKRDFTIHELRHRVGWNNLTALHVKQHLPKALAYTFTQKV